MTDFVVTGSGGALGSVLMRELVRLGRPTEGLVSPHGPVPFTGQAWSADLLDSRTYRERVLALAPKVIVHLGAVALPSEAYADPERARRVNVESTSILLSLAEKCGARFLYASTDLVFDGEEAPYSEDDAPEPSTIYGRTKLEAEAHVFTYKRGLAIRFPLMYGFPDAARKPTFFETMVENLRTQKPVRLFTDEYRTPLWLDDAARACIALADSELRGAVHVGGPERLSRFEMGERVATAIGAPVALLQAVSRDDFASPEPRVRDVSLVSQRYADHFGGPPGRAMHEAMALLLAQPPNRLLS
ncbi:MAG TPA: SDR family oxidoreductase [Polyangiales bacterium]|nr:SDR family oxidoreductase [Polyangiales bacterium]